MSGEAKYLSECLIKSPELWKGAILLSPTDLPEFPKQTIFQARPKILISIGDGESLVSQLKAYQANALKFGVNVDVTTHSGEWDNLTGNLAQLERAKAIMHFIFEK